MEKLKRSRRVACIPCGREVVVDCCGVLEEDILCCGRLMQLKDKPTAKKK